MQDLMARIQDAVAGMERRDRALAEEMAGFREKASTQGAAATLTEAIFPERVGLESAAPGPEIALETIVLRTGRPVLAVVRDEALLEFRDADSEVWRQRLVAAKTRLACAVKAVGRVEVAHHPRVNWLGTGWLVADDILVTNRHVANEFGRSSGSGFVFRQGSGRRMTAAVDFLEEFGRLESRELRVRKILHIEGDSGPDLALLQIERRRGEVVAPIALASGEAREDQQVAVIGYPAKDSRIPDQDLMESIFGNVFNKKRLAPGQITGRQGGSVLHDCSTLGGNSGSVVLDLASGAALGLHFAGRFLEANFAVPASTVADRLRRVTHPAPRPLRRPIHEVVRPEPVSSGAATTFTIPVRVTLEVGAPVADREPARPKPPTRRLPPSPPVQGDDDDEVLLVTEARPEDYADRPGYDPEFLGADAEVPLPAVGAELEDDVLTYELDGQEESELRYQHFSVVMSRSRRLCLLSAVNLDGRQSRGGSRPRWRLDPRIPEDAQILKECYGNPPKFSRGHMTRRQDPVWGDEETAALGNADSMHVTNAVPQMQVFNGGIWLGLEDYALDHARQDDMRISVFTGPFLHDDDPVLFGVQVPRSFWKVIAFLHDDTGELSATGYTMSQEAFLGEEEFVFGEHETSQVPIATIEAETGLSFGDLSDRDPLRDLEEALPGPLTDFRQIRF